MAISTFDKTIILDKEAAERLAIIAEKPAPPLPNLGDEYFEENKRRVTEWINRYEKQYPSES